MLKQIPGLLPNWTSNIFENNTEYAFITNPPGNIMGLVSFPSHCHQFNHHFSPHCT